MSIQAERLMVEVQADVRDVLRKLDQVEAHAGKTSSRMTKMARGMGLAFGGAAVVGGIKKTIGLAMDFDATMRQVGVQTGRTGKELQGLSKLALKMGKDTVFSAQDASGAMLELAKGGLTAAQIQGGALNETMRLAAAGGIDLANAATYVTQGMTTFGIKAKDAAQVTTALAGGANASTASVESLGMALSQVGAGASDAGMSLQETVGALAAMENAGVKGSDAGTALKTMLARLVPTTDKAAAAMRKYGLDFVKANGEFVTMRSVAGQLRKGLGKLGEAERAAALEAIFGSDARRAASILMRNGEKGIRKYEKATRDTAKTQEMANSAMEGAKGAWENFKGSVETAAIRIGTKLLPAFTEAADQGADFVAEAMTWGPQIEESFGWTVDAAKGLASAMSPLVDLAQSATKAWSSLPGPVKEVGIQAALAAVIFPRLASAATSAGTSVSGAFTRMSAKARQFGAEMTYAQTRTQALMGAAKVAAGVGGMMALTNSMGQAEGAAKTLTGVAGGALLGFSLAGPWGAAIGAGAGALLTLGDNTRRAADAALKSTTTWENYASTLDQVSLATTEATRSMVVQELQQNGLLKASTALGIDQQTMINGVLGEGKARGKLSKAIRDEEQSIRSAAKAWLEKYDTSIKKGSEEAQSIATGIKQRRKNLDALKAEVGELETATEKAVEHAAAVKNIPKEAITKVMTPGAVDSTKEMLDLQARFNLNPKQVRTLVKMLGTDAAKIDLGKVIAAARELDRQRPKPTVLANTALAMGAINAVRHNVQDLDGDTATVTITTLRRELTGGRNRGTQGSGGNAGLGGGTIPGQAYGGPVRGPGGPRADKILTRLSNGEFVLDAETTKRARPLIEALHQTKGRILGFASGGAVGKGKGKAKKVFGADVVQDMVNGIRAGMKDTVRVFRQLDRTIKRNLGGKKERQVLRQANRAEAAILSRQQRVATLDRRLQSAQDLVGNRKQAKASFVDATRAGMTSQATVLNAGNTAAHIGASLKIQAAKVKEFAGYLKKMRGMGYSNAIVAQVAEAGVEGGMQAAKALATGGTAQMHSINADFATITNTANATATQLGAQLHDAGIKAAEGLVAGLKKRRKAVQDEMVAMAMAMQKALKKALGIRSPARKMVGPGIRTVDGYTLGMRKQTKRTVGKAAAYMASTAIAGSTSPSTAALSGGQRAGSSVSFVFQVHNPKDEPVSRTTNKALAKVASLGLV